MDPILAPTPSESVRHPELDPRRRLLLGLMSTIGMAMPYPILAPIFVDGPVDAFTHFCDCSRRC